MKFQEEINNYLSGSLFSNGLKVKFEKNQHAGYVRLEYLKKVVENKSIIHVGCVDHLPLIEKKISENLWLHKLLNETSSRCIGIDINQDGVNYMIDKLGYKDTVHLNIITDEIPFEIETSRWHYMVLGEILEHVDNPVEFLTSIKQKYGKITDRLIITVPNAFSFNSIRNIFKNTELINSDHRYWFTPYTLAKVAIRSGFTVEEFQMCKSFPIHKKISLRRYLSNKFPLMNDSILMILKF